MVILIPNLTLLQGMGESKNVSVDRRKRGEHSDLLEQAEDLLGINTAMIRDRSHLNFLTDPYPNIMVYYFLSNMFNRIYDVFRIF